METRTDGVFVGEEKISPSLALYGLDNDLSSLCEKKNQKEGEKRRGMKN